MKKYILILFIVLFPVWVFSATYYVSNAGSGSTCSIGSPCTIAYAMSNAVAGDIWLFRGGTYTVPTKNGYNYLSQSADGYHGYYEPQHSGTAGSPITFRAYTGETPILNGTAAGGEGVSGQSGETMLGTYDKTYIVFDGFTLQVDGGLNTARMVLGSNDLCSTYVPISTHVTIQNCYFSGGSTVQTNTDNVEGLRIECVSDTTVQNNTFYHYMETNNYHNTSAIKTYDTANTLVKNNEFSNNTNTIYFKRDCQNCTVSYNYIHDTDTGIYASAYNIWSPANLLIYQNVIVNFTGTGVYNEISDGQTFATENIYNNSMYSTYTTGEAYLIIADGTGHHLYNNALQVPHAPTDYGSSVVRHTSGSVLTEQDYNSFGNTNFMVRGPSGSYYSTLATWAASSELSGGGHPDTHSLNSATSCFTNGSGNLNTLNDFLIKAPCVGTGKAGADMGANVALVGTGGTSAGTTTTFSGGTRSGCKF
jgi:hypothetical protein